MRFIVSLVGAFRVAGSGGSAPTAEEVGNAIETHLDAVMEELLHLGAEDTTIDLDLSRQVIEFAVQVSAVNPLGAAAQASGLLRSAIHAAGGATPDWPDPDDETAWQIQLVSVHSELVEADEPEPHHDDDCDLQPV
jgi:hypothetical protein